MTSGGKGGESSWEGEPKGDFITGVVFLNQVLDTQVSIVLFFTLFHVP